MWYYDKKKWKGKKLSTALAQIDKYGKPIGGGCCTWYDEKGLFQRIQDLVGSEIPSLIVDKSGKLALPAEVCLDFVFSSFTDEALFCELWFRVRLCTYV